MDNLPQNLPQVPIPQKSFFQTFLGKLIIVLAGIIILGLIILILNYFNLITLSQLSFLTKSPSSKINQTLLPSPTPSQKLTLSCPVPKEYCSKGLTLNFNNHPAIGFNIPAGGKITSLAGVEDFSRSSLGFRHTFIFQDNCYTVTYTVPKGTQIKKVDLLPLAKGEPVATSSSSTLEVDNQKVNLILQLQKHPLDPKTLGKPNFQRCGVTNIPSSEAGEYQRIDPALFE